VPGERCSTGYNRPVLFTFNSLALAWIALAIVAAILEVSIPHFGVVFVGVAAIAAALGAFFGLSLVGQLAIFVVVLAVSLMVLRPRLIKQLDAPGVPSRVQSLIGRDGVVTHDIEQTVGAGRVNVGGEDWAARANQPIAAGTRIRVVGADGIVLEVSAV
jgi:membrane protein implicated in regulation of membrane protease activity